MLHQRNLARRGILTRPVIAPEFPLLRSRFNGVSLNANVGGWRTLSGVDSDTGHDWSTPIFGGRPRIQLLNTTLVTEIVQGVGHNGDTKNLLHLKLVSQDSGITQAPLMIEPTVDVTEYYIKAWHKLSPNLATVLGSGGWVAPGPEMKTGTQPGQNDGDFRIMYDIIMDGGSPSWEVKWDQNAANSNGTTFYTEKKKTPPVPVNGEWYMVEVYVKRGYADGRSWFKVNGTTVWDHTGTTIYSKPINRIFLGSCYSSGPMDFWLDEVEVWDHIPGTGGGTGGVTKMLYLNTGANSALPAYHDLGVANVESPGEAGGPVASGGTETLLTNGSLAAQFVTGRAPAGGFTLPAGGAVAFSMSGNDPNGSGHRYRAKLFKRSTGGTETLIGTWDATRTLALTGAPWAWSGTIGTTVGFAEDERLVLKMYVKQQSGGTVPGGYVSLNTGQANYVSTTTITTSAPVTFKAEGA